MTPGRRECFDEEEPDDADESFASIPGDEPDAKADDCTRVVDPVTADEGEG